MRSRTHEPHAVDFDWPHPFGYSLMPDLPASAPRRGSALGAWLGGTVLRLLGWRLSGPYPDTPKLVIAGGPHTSNWDGIIGFAAILALRLDVRFLVKHTLFRGPVGWVLRGLRAIPVAEGEPRGITQQVIELFEREERLVVGVTPEGARKKVERWKTGFYRIAEGAKVPILTVALDFGRKEIRAGPTFFPSGDLDGDCARMRAFMATAVPKYPENF